ncbi:MAG: right-handed parallel beta-helix repeat-containing protein [Candidatus Lokiarchaeota archaeon]|nr:right-handed parallel beta-helix repeat-containing protein [Candidatus Lokiarchaeota archaeon]
MTSRKGMALSVMTIIIACSGTVLGAYAVLSLGVIEGDSGESGTQGNYPAIYCASGAEVQEAIDSIGLTKGLIVITQDFSVSEPINIDGGGEYIIQGAEMALITIDGDFSAFNISRALSCVIKQLTLDGSAITSDDVPMISVNERDNNPVHIENIQFIGGVSNDEARGVYVNSDHVWVEDSSFANLYQGICSEDAYYCHILDNYFNEIKYSAIFGTGFSRNVLQGNIMFNVRRGIRLYDYSNSNSIISNIIRNFTQYGVLISYCYLNSIVGNSLNNDLGKLESNKYGIYIGNSEKTAITGNTVNYVQADAPGTGYGFYMLDSDYNTVVGNVFTLNDVPLYNASSYYNEIDLNVIS